ncbi:MAG TPA: hypothetical protein V6D11_33105 [Waterburya sp.]|jgi:hypothetical protein
MQSFNNKHKRKLNNCQSNTGQALQPKSEERSQQLEQQRSQQLDSASGSGKISQHERSPLTEFHKQHRLSDALDWLEARGIVGESALFILAMVGGEA